MRYIHSNIKSWINLKPKARFNRNHQTNPEKVVWNMIRNKRTGVRFRRQHAIHTYIVDFVCIDKMLVIEIDGETHIGKEEYDNERTRVLNEQGFRVIRFSNEQVLGNPNLVEKEIMKILSEETSPPAPLQRRGEIRNI